MGEIKEEGMLDLNLSEQNEDEIEDMENKKENDDNLFPDVDKDGHTIIKPEKSATSLKQRRSLTRSDGFRKFIKKRATTGQIGLKSKSQEEFDYSPQSEVKDNRMNESIESTHEMSLMEDSLDGGSVDEFPMTIIHNVKLDDDDVDQDEVDEDSISDTSSVHTDIGINDSVTNFQLLRGYIYGFVVTCLTTAWDYVSAGVLSLYNTYIASPPTIEGDKVDPDKDSDEADSARPKSPQTEPDYKKLFNICNELLTTERKYVKRLGVLVKIKAKTASILQPDVAKTMFHNIEVIHQFHHDNLLPQLEERIKNWEDHKRIGDIMVKLVPFLKLYTEYVKSYGSANDLFEQWRLKSGSFANLVKEIENTAEYGRLKVQAHMLEPIQRVPRYELLLKDYLRKLPEDSPDRPDTEEALKLVGGAAKHFEEMMRRDTRICELMKLQSQFEGSVNIVSPDRELIHHGKIRVVNSRAGKISDRIIHLFNDMLLISSEQKYLVYDDKYRVRHEVSFDSLKVVYGNNLEAPYTFFIHSKDNIIELSASSPQDRKFWMNKIMSEVRRYKKTDSCDFSTSNHYNEAVIDENSLKWRYTFQVTADCKNWKKRTFSLYENGLLSSCRPGNEKCPLATVHISNFQVGTGSISQRKGKVWTLVGEQRTYHIHDDNQETIDNWYRAIKTLQSKFQLERDASVDEWDDVIVDNNNRNSTTSVDSGIDTMSYTSQNSRSSTAL